MSQYYRTQTFRITNYILISGISVIIMANKVCSKTFTKFSPPGLNMSYVSSADPIEHNPILTVGLALTGNIHI